MSAVNLKEALIECLDASLSADGEVRKSAEARLKALEVTDSFGIHLLEILRDNNYSRGRRQLASVLLRQYVDTHWTPSAEKFVAPEPPEHVKARIRADTPVMLDDPESKIRNSVASVISSIAHWDWPEQWPNLFDVILPLLKDQRYVNGALQVLVEVVKELSDTHILQIASTLFSELHRILNNTEFYSKRMHILAIEIFRELCYQIHTNTSDNDKKAIAPTLDNVFQQFMQTFALVLQQANAGPTMKRSVVRTIAILLRVCPKQVQKYLDLVLGPIWGILTSNVEEFRRVYSHCEDEFGEAEEDEENSIPDVIFAIFELIQIILENPQWNKLVKNGLNELIYYVVFYMQLPQTRVKAWLANPVAFATDEDEDNATYNLRVCAQDLLNLAEEEFPVETVSALGRAVERHMSGNTTYDWKIQEACLGAVCYLGTKITKPTDTNSNSSARTGGSPSNGTGDSQVASEFNIHGFVKNIVIPGITSADCLLAGRCLVLGANFCTVLTPEVTLQFVKAAGEFVSTERPTVTRILAAKAFLVFLEQAKESPVVKMALLQVLPGTVEPMINFAAMQPVEIMSGFLDVIIGFLELDENFAASVAHHVTTFSIACFVRFNSDPVICPAIEEIVSVLCRNPKCVHEVQERFSPTLTSVLNNAVNTQGDLGGPQSVALDILTSLVRSSPAPLSPTLMNAVFPAVVSSLQRSEDQAVLQNGGECLRSFVSKSPDQVYEWRDNCGTSGLAHVVSFAIRLLDPSSPEFSATFVGRLVTALIVKTGDKLGDQLELLLRAVLSKLRSADTLTVIQNLCLVFAHLLNTQMEPSLNFLESVPGPTGQSALHFVMTEWVSRQSCFYGQFDRKVTAIALSKILQHGVTSNDTRLTSIQVKGDPIVDPNTSRVVTRSQSRSKPQEWTTIPLLVKIFKLLIHELSCCFVDDDDYETDSENEGTDGDDNNDKENVFVGDELYNDNDEESGLNLVDPDVVNDPIFGVNFEDYLTSYLQEFSHCPYYQDFYHHVTPEEGKVLNTCLNKALRQQQESMVNN